MFVPLSFGSDKTTVSVATGQNNYYPLYMFLSNLNNSARQAHRDSVLPLTFISKITPDLTDLRATYDLWLNLELMKVILWPT